jgi:hypothetical protein
MKIFFSIFLVYWTLGMFLLPKGDFSALKDLHEQFKHCKETEDKDMTVVDFITDHLINIDGIFDKHNKGDEQKPHTPSNFAQHNFLIAIAFPETFTVSLKPITYNTKVVYGYSKDDNYTFNFNTSVFHPPLI